VTRVRVLLGRGRAGRRHWPKSVRQAGQQLSGFVHLVERGERMQRITGDVGDPLVSLARSAMAQIARLVEVP
jgi:hypothetical protein